MTTINRQALNKALIAKMQRDLKFYSKVCLSIRTKAAKIEPLTFNFAQNHVHKKLHKQYKETGRIRCIVLKARQEGVSTYTAARFFRRLHLFPNQEALVLADELDRAKKLFSIYDRFAHLLPPEIAPMTRYVSKQTQLVLDNPDDKLRSSAPGLGSSITVETAGDTAVGRASTPTLVHASEMAFWDKAQDAWISLMQGVPDKNSEVIIESTANGVGNFFHQVWTAAEEGTNGYVPIFLPWWIHEEYRVPKLKPKKREEVLDTLDSHEREWYENGIKFENKMWPMTLEQIQWRRQTIQDKLQGDERAFRQEYPATPEEAFLVSGNCFFDEDSLKTYETHASRPVRHNITRIGNSVLPRPAEMGYLRIWKKPDQKDATDTLEPLYVIGADTASGRQVSARDSLFSDPNSERGGRDFSSADVVDIRNRRQVAQLHGRMAPDIFADMLYNLGIYYGNKTPSGLKQPAKLAVEKNHSSGETVLRILQQEKRYPNLYFGKQINRRANRTQHVLGWSTTVETRMPMLDNLAAAIREGTISVPNRDSIREMYTFVRGEDGKPQAQEGAHDDRVISLAIALFVGETADLAMPLHYTEVDLEERGDSPTGYMTYA